MRVEDLVARHELAPEAVSRFTVLLDHLARDEAPTTVHARPEAVAVHLADALSGLAVPALRDARRLADLGAGAGVPGLVLAAALPACRVALVESVARKTAFIAEAAEAMGLDNVDVVTARAEDWRDGREAMDAVTARALAALPVLCEYAAPLLREGGALVAWKGHLDDEEAADGAAAAQILGLSEPESRPAAPYPGSQNRRLVVARKIAPTPARFPRRAGMAVKRPLSARRRAG